MAHVPGVLRILNYKVLIFPMEKITFSILFSVIDNTVHNNKAPCRMNNR